MMENNINIEYINKNGVMDFISDYVDVDEYVSTYEQIASDLINRDTIETQTIQNLCEIILRYGNFEDNTKILDLGCGNGYNINNISGVYNRYAVDVSLNNLNNVEPEVIRVRCFAENTPFEDNLFDVIICTDVFEHVKDENVLINEIYRILKPNGILFFSSPMDQDLSVYDSEEFKSKYKSYKWRHLRSVNWELLDKVFDRFELVATTEIVNIRRFMTIKPYSIQFCVYKKTM